MSDSITKAPPVTSEVYAPAIHMNPSVFICRAEKPADKENTENIECNRTGSHVCDEPSLWAETPADKENTGNVECNRRESHSSDQASLQGPVALFSLLSVRIIRMTNLREADLLSHSDCYVGLRLPSSSFINARTKTISNSKNPVWNETFFFRIQTMAKNILEITLYDEDSPLSDEELCCVTFDIANLQPEERVCKRFEMNKEENELLEVEFYLENISDMPENLISNGVVLSRELCCLKVEVNHRERKKKRKKQTFACTLRGSYEDAQNILLDSSSRDAPPNHTTFHYAKYCNPKLEIQLLKKRSICCPSNTTLAFTVPLYQVPLGERIEVGNDKAYEFFVTEEKCQKSPDMRLGFDLCPEEQDFICKRKKYVAAALKNVLRLEGELQDNEVPVVALMTTAGGVRSMTAMYGSLLGLQKLNLLQCVSYITGLSGTTWAMINLFRDPYWSHKNLEGVIMDVRKQVMKNKLCCFSPDNLKYYEKEIWNRHDEGHKLTFADLWGLILESMFHDEPDPNKLSDQRRAINLGQNPLPIYLALNVKKRYSTLDFKEWMEFTPYEVGFLKYGAFINAENFGSEFYMGHLMKKIPESRLCFMQGMWSNIYSQNLLDALYLAECSEDFWHKWTRPRMYEIEEDTPPWLPKRPYVQPTRLFIPNGSVSDAIKDVVTMRPVVACYPNFIKGLQMNNKYLENNNFSMWKDTILDCSPNHLTESEDYLELVDTAFFINTSCPPLLRPERQVDIIIHLNYSGGSQTLPLDLSTRYYHGQGIPFPKTDLTEEDRKNLKECYLFDDAESPKAPILLYFPLVCDSFQKYKSPGVERAPSEMDDGYADVTSTVFSPYATGILQYSEEDFNKLINLTHYNILNNEHMILQALRTAVERKKQQNFRSSF
ncbi:cytosolic phospholipase A2 epsilon-like [Thamnophis elegans]|uniref:cytosolic phospholipase A2 epsilon-like n=1 Tax=Thamnophis elegans TaxID=35005 RepID=UPI0013786923|nr:cytosolic phospholipase A2 epsilon-like [Thamnophis elegans]